VFSFLNERGWPLLFSFQRRFKGKYKEKRRKEGGEGGDLKFIYLVKKKGEREVA